MAAELCYEFPDFTYCRRIVQALHQLTSEISQFLRDLKIDAIMGA